ncbi:gliding motility-associated C-terminal domain-containing protein [Spirosoma sp. BT702]|uniref:Gliding motility-associated C-terminal domain-containing protein n=1 Tax=Spirosoma profusum TaxID=2771354 RepID=A0A927GA96_9BACT|nr:gliding motility-associated C-terminal domain-containing protein [Spirosoma profusum]MBD2705397.1 gliding motility-associated C-terminal domain-containing protein [Spirosoma profusum]
MWISSKHIRVIGLCAVLLLLAGLRVAWAQAAPSFKVSGKACVPDQECKADSLTFRDSVLTGVTQRVWDFGDGTTVTKQRDSVARHVYQQARAYTVRLTRTVNGVTQTTQQVVNVGNRPQPFVNWRTDTTICKNEVPLTLDPYAGGPPQSGLRFIWYPKGDTTQTIQVDSSGCYSVEVINSVGCSYQDRVNVDICGQQKDAQGVKWYFGQNAGLDFSGGGSPKPITDGKLNTIEGSSSIADTKGKLLFYSDGITIYDKDGKPMKSLVPGDTTTTQIPLGGNKNSTQSALIVPKPTCRGCEYLYYVYTTSEIRGQKTLTYSVVDMRQDGGKGAIVEKNIPVSSSSTEQSASVKNERDSTFWVITRKYGSNEFEARHLTREEEVVVVKSTGNQVVDSLANAEGYIKIGPADTTSESNRPMAVVIPGPPKNLIELYTFNDSTGKITYNRTIDIGPAPPKAYGVEFSPDGENLYVTMLADTNSDGSQKGSSYLLRYDLSQPDSLISRSKMVVDSSTTRQYGALQIGPDGRIYVAIQGSQSLGTIENPNGGLLDSLQFNPQGQTLGGQTSQLGLPNLVANFNDNSSGPGLTYGDTCVNAPTVFQISPNCPKLKEAYTLDFGDGSRPVSTTTTDPINHPYARPGTYYVSLRIVTRSSSGNGFCMDTLIRDTLTILETPPDINLGADTAICNKKGITLDLKVQAKVYVWLVNGSIASRQKTIKLERPGYYYVVGLAANGECFKSDTIEVQIKPPPTLDLGPDTLFCYRSSVNIRVPQQQYVQFQWSNGETTRSIAVSKAGTYSVTAQTTQLDGTTCENSDTIRVTELPKVRVAATLTQPLGCTSTDGVIELTPTPAGNYRYDWTTSDGTAIADTINRQDALTEGKYDINVTEVLHGCEIDTSFTLKSPANTLAITPRVRDALCSVPNSGTISLNVTGGTPATYQWIDQTKNIIATTPVFGNAAPGLYLVQIVDEKGCKASMDSIRVGLDSTGLARLGPDTLKCIGGIVVLAPLSGDTPGNTYQWSTGATTPTISVEQPGSYSLSVVNTQNGCKGRASIRVNDRPAPNFSYTQQASLCEGDLGTVRLSANGAAGLRFLWLIQNDTTRNVTVNKAGQYAVQVTDPQGCTATGVARVLNLCEPRVNTPDAFTPNNDGINDVLQIFTAYITDYEFRIYNRWGEVIFVSNSPEQKWDGTYKGSTYPSMLYPYIVQYRSESFPERGVITKRGSVMLLR